MVTVDVRNKKAVFKDGLKLAYSKLLRAPGSRWEGPPAPARPGEGSRQEWPRSCPSPQFWPVSAPRH